MTYTDNLEKVCIKLYRQNQKSLYENFYTDNSEKVCIEIYR